MWAFGEEKDLLCACDMSMWPLLPSEMRKEIFSKHWLPLHSSSITPPDLGSVCPSVTLTPKGQGTSALVDPMCGTVNVGIPDVSPPPAIATSLSVDCVCHLTSPHQLLCIWLSAYHRN